MFSRKRSSRIWMVLVLVFLGLFTQIGESASFKVLVVMSYHEQHPFYEDYRKGIEIGLADQCEIRYVYLDALRHPEEAKAKVQEAYAEYQNYQPDGVIVANDEAQIEFVVPYLKDKEDIPVMFCGVNADPNAYGYPDSKNVSGILVRPFFREAFEFVKQLVPSIETMCYISPDIPTMREIEKKLVQEKATYPVSFAGITFATTFDDAVEKVKELKQTCDALFLAPMYHKDETVTLVKTFAKPTLAPFKEFIEYGVLCAVIESSQEQGQVAAEMLLKAMNGTPLSELPITRNQYGRRLLNVDEMKSLGIQPTMKVLTGVELLRTVK